MSVYSEQALILINFISKNPGCLKNNDPPGSQLEVFGGLWVSASPRRLFFYNKLAKPADQDVFSVLQRLFHDLKKPFDNSPGLAFAESHLIINTIDNFFFGQGHL